MNYSTGRTARNALICLGITTLLEFCWICQILYLDTILLNLSYTSLDSFRESIGRETGVPWLFSGLILTFLLYQASEFVFHVCMAIWNVELYRRLERKGIHRFRYGPVMAMVGWLVPGVSLIVPLWVMEELQGFLLPGQPARLTSWWLMEFLPAGLSAVAFSVGFLTGIPWIALGIYLIGRGVYMYHASASVRIIRSMDAAR